MTKPKEKPESLAEKVVAEIEDDLRSRHGIGAVWNSIDPDTQAGIRRRWVELAGEVLGAQ